MNDLQNSLPLIIAHRGDSSNFPENTFAAIENAIALGSDGIEFDVRLAKDGVPVVIHDSKLLRTSGIAGRVAEFTSGELAGLDVTSWFKSGSGNGKVEAQGVPCLQDVLSRVKAFPGKIFIELKCGEHDVEPLTRAVSSALESGDLDGNVVVKSFRLSMIPLLKRVSPDIKTAALFAPKIMTVLRKEKYLVKLAAEFGVDELSIHHSLATRKLVKKAEKYGLPVTVWTVDRPRWVKRAVSRGVKAIITNDPAMMMRQRSKLAEKLAPENR